MVTVRSASSTRPGAEVGVGEIRQQLTRGAVDATRQRGPPDESVDVGCREGVGAHGVEGDVEAEAEVPVGWPVEVEAVPLQQHREVGRLLELDDEHAGIDAVRRRRRNEHAVADVAPSPGGAGRASRPSPGRRRARPTRRGGPAGSSRRTPCRRRTARRARPRPRSCRTGNRGGRRRTGGRVDVHGQALPGVEQLDEQGRRRAPAGDVGRRRASSSGSAATRSCQRPETPRSVSPDPVGAPPGHRRGEPLLGSPHRSPSARPPVGMRPATQRGDALAAAIEVVDHVRRQRVRLGGARHRRTHQVALALDDRRVDAHQAGGTAVAVEALERQLGAAPTELDRIVVDDGDRRVVDARRVEVAEGDDGRRPPPRAQARRADRPTC